MEAFRLRFLPEQPDPVPLYFVPIRLDLIKEHSELIAAIKADTSPVAVVLDTLNRGLVGSERNDKDMSEYVRAADAIREAFNCSVIIVHHCGINDSRPRGHTSLTGAADAQIAVKRGTNDSFVATVEFMKDGPQGITVGSRLESVEIGTDEDGETITSCVVVAAEAPEPTSSGTRLTPNQETFLEVLSAAKGPLTSEEWRERAVEAGLGSKRKAWAWDLRHALHKKGLVYEGANGWSTKSI